jgi:SAM-dependent methyltransferase
LNFISFRRYYLDLILEENKHVFKGRVLDVGGKRDNRRGSFEPPYEQVEDWVFLNNDKQTNPDILIDLPNIPLEDNSIDVVLCTEVMEYIYDFRELLFQMGRVIKPGGVLILSTPFIGALHGDSEGDYYRFTESLLIKELTDSFTIESVERMGGIVAVIYDLFRSYMSYQTKRSFMIRVLSALFIKSNRFFIWLDKKSFKNNYYINSGFLLVVRKK